MSTLEIKQTEPELQVELKIFVFVNIYVSILRS